ncbi:zinc finger protein 510-like [Toxorhynchites rutilus septentrionalis]|uniref:zinc finger protein 510-like n=1 Tax=Toxorhynchites rutilus septentrionalis TaxID=329112 RepID=UPI002478CA71|nr:zinc finger protein 510-like [Toxorhynchites rutilus septentrionalis]
MALSHAQITELARSCRLCLSHGGKMHPIHAGSCEPSLPDLILHLTGILPSNGDSLHEICEECHKQIYDFMTFRGKIQQSNAELVQKDGVVVVNEMSEQSKKFNDNFTQLLSLNEVVLDQNESTEENDPESDQETLSDPLENEDSKSDEQFEVRKLSKRDLSAPKAYYGLCNICGKEYKHLWRHLESHNTVLVDRCKVCGKEFKSKTALQKHELMHQDAEHGCDVCGKKYRTKNRLRRHYRTHTNDRPFSCDNCGKRFYTRYNLEVHSRVHTGDRPYTCQYCGLQFIHSYAVKNHMDRFHLEILALKDP